MNLNLPYKVAKIDRERIPNDRDITVILIKGTIASNFPKDMERTDSRIWGKLMDKLESCLDNELDELDLNDTEFDWLYKQVDKVKLPPSMAQWFWVFMDYMDEENKKD